MFKKKLFWIALLFISFIIGMMMFINSLDISPASKQIKKKIPNEEILEVIK